MSDYLPNVDTVRLAARAAIVRRLRDFFERRGCLEVVTPILSRDTVVDRHLDPFVTTYAPDPRMPDYGERFYLQTSPEFAMKRLLAGGAGSIYQFAQVFRNGEYGAFHNPEFTMLEWYRLGEDYSAGRKFLDELAQELFQLGPAEELTYAAAFERTLGICPHRATHTELIATAAACGTSIPASLADDRDGLLDLLLTERVQPTLGRERPTILYDYPASQAALARLREEPFPVAERYELFVAGVELANGYHELLDAAALVERNRVNNAARINDRKPPLPGESHLLTAMSHGLPACCGCALGFDRALQVLWDEPKIERVLAFPWPRA